MVSTVLDPDVLGDTTPADLAERTGIPLDRVEKIIETGELTLYEAGAIAEDRSINPSYLVRPRPVVAANRASGSADTDLANLLETFDLHVDAFKRELDQPRMWAFPVNSWNGAKSSGEKWAANYLRHPFSVDQEDPLLQAIEQRHRIPVLFWPVPNAPFGATLRLFDTLAIWINTHDVPGSQQRFTLAHELGHIICKHVDKSRIEPATDTRRAEEIPDEIARIAEEHANAAASGTLSDHARIMWAWNGETSAEAVALVAAQLGMSYQAATFALKTHLRSKVAGIEQIAAGTPATVAAERAGVSEVFEYFESQRNRKRVPAILEYSERLEEALASATD